MAYSVNTLKETALPLLQYIREHGYEFARRQDSAAIEAFQRDIFELLAELGSIIDEMDEFPHRP